MSRTVQSSSATASDDRRNFDLREDIRAYWAARSETFDLSSGHKIRSDAELREWGRLFTSLAPLAPGSRVLELASGTGEVTRVLRALQCEVDAIDLCEPMIARAKAKHPDRHVRFHLGDAENTMMPDATYDAVICRHLVWTLIDPVQALADWHRVLKPGGVLVIVDGDWVSSSLRSRVFSRISAVIDQLQGEKPLWDQRMHQSIVERVHFKTGLRLAELERMLTEAGFTEPRRSPVSGIKRRQFVTANLSERMRLIGAAGRTFALSVRRP
ncbi:MAG: methyltransferase domain-containing protein [Beijerinckiaceae bacterium]|nr:methyltransferase domain-containing protein [Beijerinckiaceae bacterium]